MTSPRPAEPGRPQRDLALQPAWQLALARERQLATLDAASQRRYGLVPLERLDVPPDLSGCQGTFRVAGPKAFGAEDDLAALQAWLQRHAMSPTDLPLVRACGRGVLPLVRVRAKEGTVVAS